MFVKFIEQLKTRLLKPLPGEAVQFLMAPPARMHMKGINPDKYNPQKSAVLILLFPENDKLFTVLIERPIYEGVHSGQAAFPGGKFDKSDIDLKQTALRETYEEVGVPADKIEIIGKLTDLYINPSNFLVSPFIGFINKRPHFILNAYEVQKIITVDIFTLNDGSIKSEKTITHSSGYKIKTPCYEIDGLTVWGATAMMISEFNVIVKEANAISF